MEKSSVKKAIGITIHYDDSSIDKVAIDTVVNAIAARPAGRSNVNWLNADECPIHGPWKLVPAGHNEAKGTQWRAFYTCDTEQGAPRCTNKPAREWVETHPPEPPPVSSSAGGGSPSDDFDDLPFG